MKKTKLAVTFALSCALLISGCAEKNVSEEYTVPDFEAQTEIAADRKNIYLIVKNYTSSYWQVIVDGVRDGGNDYGVNIYSSGSSSEAQWQLQSDLIDKAVAEGADAIIFAPNDSVKLSPKVSEIYRSGIPIVLVDTVVNTQDYDVCYMTDNLFAGQNAAEEMICRFRDAGIGERENVQVAVQVGGTSSQTINERLAGFCQYWTKNAPSSWVILDDVRSNDGDIDKAVGIAESFLDTYPAIKGVFGCNNGSTVGFARVVKERNRTDISVVGFDYSEEMKALITDDNFNAATMLQKQYLMGYRAVETVIDIMNGEKPESKFVDTGVVMVNKNTISDPEIKEIISHN